MARIRAALASREAPPAAQTEAIYRWRYINGGDWVYDQKPDWIAADLDIIEVQPLYAAPPPASQQEAVAASPEATLLAEVLAELNRARAKFPGKNVTFAALVEEVGELATATFEESAARVRKEAVQVAVMALRMILDGDHCFEPWRAEKGLHPLDPALRTPEVRA